MIEYETVLLSEEMHEENLVKKYEKKVEEE